MKVTLAERGHGYRVGDYVEINGRRFTVTRVTHTTFGAEPVEHWGWRLARIALVAACALALMLFVGCAAPETRVETRTSTNTVSVPAPVACFDPADLPRLPSKTVVDPAKATTDQLAAAAAADRENFMLYAQTVSELWAQCAKALKGVPK